MDPPLWPEHGPHGAARSAHVDEPTLRTGPHAKFTSTMATGCPRRRPGVTVRAICPPIGGRRCSGGLSPSSTAGARMRTAGGSAAAGRAGPAPQYRARPPRPVFPPRSSGRRPVVALGLRGERGNRANKGSQPGAPRNGQKDLAVASLAVHISRQFVSDRGCTRSMIGLKRERLINVENEICSMFAVARTGNHCEFARSSDIQRDDLLLDWRQQL